MGGLRTFRPGWAAQAAACLFAVIIVSGATAAPRNDIPNASFERSLRGWSHYQARLSRVTGGKIGRHAAKVTYKSGTGSFSMYTSPSPVPAGKPGARPLHGLRTGPAKTGDMFTAAAWVKGRVAGKRLCIDVREHSRSGVVSSDASCVSASTSWQRLVTTRYPLERGGDALDVVVFQSAPSPGDSFLVDGVSLTRQSAPKLPPPPPPTSSDPIVLAAGDIASCASSGDEATAAILRQYPDAPILTTGDNAYENGTLSDFQNCFGPSWGRFKARIHPTPGSHEYTDPTAAPYFNYFGAAAGDPGKGFYSFDVGAWHIVALNTVCARIGGCSSPSSPEGSWLRADLAAHRNLCTLAYGATPRFSSGTTHGSEASLQALWQVLYDNGVDVFLAGHEHNYERFAPQTPSGAADSSRGIREFVVGTGGRSHYPFGAPIANSEVRSSNTFGVLGLTLHPTSYDWRFIPVAGQSFTDSGSTACH